MKYVFFGSPEFAAIILESLIAADISPALVVCNPDRPVGREKIVTPPPTKIIAVKYGIPVWQPTRLTSNIDPLTSSTFDLFVVAAYAQIIPQSILDLPRLGTIGVHPSLLPKYRGATPIQSVLLAGEKETGVTLYLMDKEIDHGATIADSKWQIANSETYTKLICELAKISARLLIAVLPKFMKSKITPMPQNHSRATFTKKIQTEDGFVDLTKDDPVMIDRKVRALNPDPGVYTFVERGGKKMRMKILETKIVDEKLHLTTTQREGRKPVKTNIKIGD